VSTGDDEPLFLDVEEVLELHATQLAELGGSDGVRDRGLLDSALAQPRATFGAAYVHEGLFAMAAAYLFHIASNHPFVDGNKRVGLLSALVFLDLNGISIVHPTDALYELTMGVAEGRLGKPEIAAELERIARRS
jgi:death-on-curing protein